LREVPGAVEKSSGLMTLRLGIEREQAVRLNAGSSVPEEDDDEESKAG
jgi:hypothetical protein